MTVIKLDELQSFDLAEGIRAQIIHSDSMSVSYVTLDSGADLPEHHHINEQIVNVIEGELELIVKGESRVLKRGMVEILPSDMPHSARALTNCYVIDVFSPPRADWIEKFGRN